MSDDSYEKVFEDEIFSATFRAKVNEMEEELKVARERLGPAGYLIIQEVAQLRQQLAKAQKKIDFYSEWEQRYRDTAQELSVRLDEASRCSRYTESLHGKISGLGRFLVAGSYNEFQSGTRARELQDLCEEIYHEGCRINDLKNKL
jgi:hypothetical protein